MKSFSESENNTFQEILRNRDVPPGLYVLLLHKSELCRGWCQTMLTKIVGEQKIKEETYVIEMKAIIAWWTENVCLQLSKYNEQVFGDSDEQTEEKEWQIIQREQSEELTSKFDSMSQKG